jgi:hypothetical protein
MITLDYSGTVYTFPGVQYENTDTLDTGLVVNIARGQSIGLSKRGYAPEIRRYIVKAVNLAKAQDVITIVTTLATQVASVTDDLGRSYQAILLTEQLELVTVKDLCSYDFTIDLVVVADGGANYLLAEDGDILTTELDDGIIL